MKRSTLKFYTLAVTLAFFTACSDDDPTPVVDEPVADEPIPDDPVAEEPEPVTFKDMESDWVRLTLMSAGKLEVMQADSGEIKYSVTSTLIEDERYYTSNSGRYLAAIDRAGGKVRFFDSGIVNHNDHGHEQESRWANAELTSLVPTHFTGSGVHMLVFNDGDGSISYINESQLEIPSYQPETFQLEGTVAHHGVGIRLNSGNFAVTFQSETPPEGYEWGPQMVKFVTEEGAVIDDNGGVEVQGIHGSANNGQYGAFGSTDGVILVDDQDNIDLIANAEGLNSESGNWLGTLKGHGNADLFFARSRNLGIFKVDPVAKTMSKMYAGNDVAGDMFSFDGTHYMVHTTDNMVRVYASATGELVVERAVEMADIPELTAKGRSEMEVLKDGEEPDPVLVASDKFLYVLAPNRTQIKVLQIADLKHVHTIELESPVESIMKNGFSIEGDQNPDYQD